MAINIELGIDTRHEIKKQCWTSGLLLTDEEKAKRTEDGEIMDAIIETKTGDQFTASGIFFFLYKRI